MDREDEEEMSELHYVDRHEQFVGSEETRRATLVASVAQRTLQSTAKQAESLRLQTAATGDTHNLTHSSVVTSGYDSSASTDVSFSSPFVSPEQEFSPFFGSEGAHGMPLRWDPEHHLTDPWGQSYLPAGQSADEKNWQEATSSYTQSEDAVIVVNSSALPSAPGVDNTAHSQTLSTKMSTYSTSVNMDKDSAGNAVSNTDAHSVYSVYTHFREPTDTYSSAVQSSEDRQAEQDVTVDDVLHHFTGKETDEYSGHKTGTDMRQDANKERAGVTEETDSSEFSQTVSKTRYSAHFTNVSVQGSDETASDSHSAPNSSEERYTSTLVFAPGEPRNAETKAADTEDEDALSDGIFLGPHSYSTTTFFSKPCAATFDVGRLRSPTPIRLTGGQWGQVSQIITPFLTAEQSVSIEYEQSQAISAPESDTVKEEIQQHVGSAGRLGTPTEFSVDTVGGDVTDSALRKTGIEAYGLQIEQRAPVVSGGEVSLQTAARHSSLLFSPEDEKQGKLCYYSHVLDDDSAEEDDDSRAVSYLDIFIKGYNKRGGFAEHKYLYRRGSPAEDSETRTTLVQRDKSSTTKLDVQSEEFLDKGSESEKSDAESKDVNQKEPETYTEYLTLLFDYSSNVDYLQQEQVAHTERYSVLEFQIKSKPNTVISTVDIAAVVSSYAMERTGEDTEVDSGKSMPLVTETEDRHDESSSATATMDDSQNQPLSLEDRQGMKMVQSGQQTDVTVREVEAAGALTIQSATQSADVSSLTPSAQNVYIAEETNQTADVDTATTDGVQKLDEKSVDNVEFDSNKEPQNSDEEDDEEDEDEDDDDDDDESDEDNEVEYELQNPEDSTIEEESANDEFEISFSAEDVDTGVASTDAYLVTDDVSNSDVVTEVSSEDQVTQDFSDNADEDDGGVGDETDNDVAAQIPPDLKDSDDFRQTENTVDGTRQDTATATLTTTTTSTSLTPGSEQTLSGQVQEADEKTQDEQEDDEQEVLAMLAELESLNIDEDDQQDPPGQDTRQQGAAVDEPTAPHGALLEDADVMFVDRREETLAEGPRQTVHSLRWLSPDPQQQSTEAGTDTHSEQENRQRCEQAVQTVMIKLQQIQVTLTQISVQPTADLDRQMEQYEETIQELQGVQREVEEVVEDLGGREVAERRREEEEGEGQETRYRWALSWLTPLLDLNTGLKELAALKGQQLQDAAVVKSEHEKALEDYMRQVCDMQSWVTEMQTARAYITLPAQLQDSSVNVVHALETNTMQQAQAADNLRQLADLDVQCAALHQLEPPAEADKLTSHSSTLTANIQSIQQLLAQEEDVLLTALKERKEQERGQEEEEEEEEKSAEEKEQEEDEERWDSDEFRWDFEEDEDPDRTPKVGEDRKVEGEEEKKVDKEEEIKSRNEEEEDEKKRTEKEKEVEDTGRIEQEQKNREEEDEDDDDDDEEDDDEEDYDEEVWSSDNDEEEDDEEKQTKTTDENTKAGTKVNVPEDLARNEPGKETDYVQHAISATETVVESGDARLITDTSSGPAEGKTVQHMGGKSTETTADTLPDTAQGTVLERTSGATAAGDREGKTLKFEGEAATEGGPAENVESEAAERSVGDRGPLKAGQTVMVTTSVLEDDGWRTVTVPDFDPSTTTLSEHTLQLQAVATELRDHQKLVQQLATLQIGTSSTDGSASLHPSPPLHRLARQGEEPRSPEEGSRGEPPVVPLTTETLRVRWEAVHKVVVERVASLDDLLLRRQNGEEITEKASLLVDKSQLLVDIGSSMSQLSDESQRLQLTTGNKELQLITVITLQYQILKIVRSMSTWLTAAQQILLLPAQSTVDTADRLQQIETLQRELQQVQGHISLLSSQSEAPSSDPGTQRLIQGSVTSLRQWVSSLELEAVRQQGALQQHQKQQQLLQHDVRELRRRLLQLRSAVKAGGTTAASVESVVSLVALIDDWQSQLQEAETRLHELRSWEAELSAQCPQSGVDTQLRYASDVCVDVRRLITEQKARVAQLTSVKEQYEVMLDQLQDFLAVGDAKLQITPVPAQDLPHLQRQLEAHKGFFSDLPEHTAGLDVAASLSDATKRQQHAARHAQLCRVACELAERAGLHCRHLETLVMQWGQLQTLVDGVHAGLLQVETGVKKMQEGGATMADLNKKTQAISQQQQQLHRLRQDYFQAVDQGRQLQNAVTSPALETSLTDMAAKWSQLDDQLQVELKKTETLTEQMQTFESDSKTLKSWLTSASNRLRDVPDLKKKGAKVPNPDSLQTQAQTVLDVRSDVQTQQPFKDRVMSTGRAVETSLRSRAPKAAKKMDKRLVAFQDEWDQLERTLNSAEQRVHELHVKHVPSQKMVEELQAFLGVLEKALQRDGDAPLTAVSEVQVLLKKCKVYSVKLAHKQQTMDALNTSLQQADSDLSPEMQKHADTVAQLDYRWKKVSATVGDRLQWLEKLDDQWSALEAAVTERHAWLSQQESRLTSCRLPAPHQAAVSQALQDCKMIQTQLQGQHAKDVEHARRVGEAVEQLITDGQDQHHHHHPEGPQQIIQQTLQSVDQLQERLQQQLEEMVNFLQDLLGGWTRYHDQLHSLTRRVTQAHNTFDRCSLVGADVDSLVGQVQTLKTLQQELKAYNPDLDSLAALASELSEKHKASSTPSDVQSALSSLKGMWQTLSAQLPERLQLLDGCLGMWRDHEARVERAEGAVEKKEGECRAAIAEGTDGYPGEEALKKCQNLQKDLEELQDTVSSLRQPSEDLARHMRPSTILVLTSRYSALEQRVRTLRHHLSQHVQMLERDLSQLGQYQDAFDALLKFLEDAGGILAVEDPPNGAEESLVQERLDDLRGLLVRFQGNADKLDDLNALGNRVALHPKDASRLLDLNGDWHRQRADCQDRCRALQWRLLAFRNFAAKCRGWADVLASAEDLLAAPVAGDLPGLLEQQRQCQTFEDELLSRQQILHGLVSDGQRVLESGQAGHPEDLRHTLQAMLHQWQSVVTRARQRKALVDSLVPEMRTLHAESDRLSSWLGERKEDMKDLEAEQLSLEQMSGMADKIKTIQQEMGQEEEKRQKVQDLATALVSRADSGDVQEVKVTAEKLQENWVQVDDQAEEQSMRLQDLEQLWARSQELLGEVLRLVKEQRQLLAGDIPDTLNDLQEALQKHQEFTTDVLRPAWELEKLKSQEAVLKKSIVDKDMNVLHQRIQMAVKLWDDLIGLAERREGRLKEAIDRWARFKARVEELCTWIEEMERKVEGAVEVHETENLPKIMQTVQEYAAIMTSKGREVDDVTSEGRYLMTLSDEVRASDIQKRLQRLEDRWRSLQELLESRHDKVQSTIDSLALLDRKLKDLNRWLSETEQKLNTPVVYKQFNMQEVQEQLQHSEDIQQDIDEHSVEVKTVLTLCKTLLEDPEACVTPNEISICLEAQKTQRTRWQHIPDLSTERRARIQETGALWEKFRADWEGFNSWLTTMEAEVEQAYVAMPAAATKEDIKKYETLGERLHDRLPDLESLNDQFHRLRREGRTDQQGTLEQKKVDVNDRWDALQRKVTEMQQALRKSAQAYEDFMNTQRSVMVWLREVDVRITKVEQQSTEDVTIRLQQIQRIEEELESEGERMENVKGGAAVMLKQMGPEEGGWVRQAVEEMTHLYGQVVDHARSCRQRLDSLPAGEDQSGEAPQTAASTEDLSATLPPDSSATTRRAGAGSTTLPQATVTPIPRSPSQELSETADTTITDVTEPAESEATRREHGVKVEVLLEQLSAALAEATAALDDAERQVDSSASSGGVLGEAQSQSLLKCKQKVDRVRHLHQLLKKEAGGPAFPTMEDQVKGVVTRWERLQSRVAHLDVRITERQQGVSRFSADVDALRAWLDEAEALQASHYPLPTDLLQLKVLIRQNRDFLAQLDEKKPRFLSIQLLSTNYVDTATPEGRELQARVQDVERRWQAVTERAADTQRSLQRALLQCQEFHHAMQDHLLWLEGMEARVRACEPVELTDERVVLRAKCKELKQIHSELLRKQPAILALRETVEQLTVVNNESAEMAAARDRMHVISSRLQALLLKTAGYIEDLEAELGARTTSAAAKEGRLPPVAHPSSYSRRRWPFAYLRQLLFGDEKPSLPADETDSAKVPTATEAAPCTAATRLATRPSLLRRVLWAALPFQLLLLLLLGIACLLPVCDEDRCLLVNNLRHSFFPMLHYAHGTPPT